MFDKTTCSRILRAGMERLPEEGGGAETMVTPKASPLKASLTLGWMPNKSSAVMIPPAALQGHSMVQQESSHSVSCWYLFVLTVGLVDIHLCFAAAVITRNIPALSSGA